MKKVDLSTRRVCIPGSPIPAFSNRNYATSFLTAPAGVLDIFVPNCACTVHWAMVQVNTACTIQLLENYEPIGAAWNVQAGTVIKFAGRLLANNARLQVSLSVSAFVSYEVAWVKNFDEELIVKDTAIMLGSVAIPSSVPYPFNRFNLTNVSVVPITGNNLAAGDIDLYTVPAGKRAIISLAHFNTTVATITLFHEVKIAGVYYRINSNVTPSTLGNGAVSNGYIFEPGEIFAINTSALGMNVSGFAILFDVANTLKCVKLLNFIVGDNTVYTCPNGRIAYLAGFDAMFNTSGANPAGFLLSNMTAGVVTVKLNLVRSGGVVAATNQMAQSALAINSTTGGALDTILLPGDFLSVNVSANGKLMSAFSLYEV